MVPQVSLSAHGPVVSRLVAGVMNWGIWGKNLSAAQMQALVRQCLDLGITTFDHADIYGDYTTEAAFGDAIQGQSQLRQQLKLVTKCGIKLMGKAFPQRRVKSYDTSRAYIIAAAEQSLRNLRTDWLDLLLIHRPDPLLDAHEVAEAIGQLKQQGKVRHFGVSNFTPAQLEVVRQATPVATNQIEASLLHRAPFLDGTLEQAQCLGFRPMAWSPLGGGSFFTASPDEPSVSRVRRQLNQLSQRYQGASTDTLLLAWLLRHPSGIVPVLGTTRPDRLAAAAAALHLELSREEWFELWEAASGSPVA